MNPLLVVVAGLLAAELPQESAPPATTAFVGVSVVPMDTERVLRDHTVLVEGERIVAVAPADGLAVPEGATVVDGTGRYLMPGLADMHVHTWYADELTLFVANGVTTVRNMFGGPVHLTWRERIAAGDLLGPTIVTAGPIVDGDPPYWPGSRVVKTAEDARAAVQEHVDAGYDFVKVYERLQPEPYRALVEAAHAAGLTVHGHVPAAVGMESVLAAGQRTVEHMFGWEMWLQTSGSPFEGKEDLPSRFCSWEHLDWERAEQAAQRFREAGAWSCGTLTVMRHWITVDELEQTLATPELRYLPRAAISTWRTMVPNQAGMIAPARAARGPRTELTRILHEAGVRMLLGTDQGNPFVVAGFAVHEELEHLFEAGLSPYEALRTGTVEAAACLEAGDEFGRVAAGLRADLLLLDANPLEDVANASRIAGVMLRGRWLPRTELDALLEELAERNAE